MTDADFIAAILTAPPELNDKQIVGLRQLLAPAPIGAATPSVALAPLDASTPPAAPRRAPARPHADVATRAA